MGLPQDDGADIERRIKQAELDKLHRELRAWNLDQWVKLAVGVLAVLGAVAVLVTGVPKAQLELATARIDTAKALLDAQQAKEEAKIAETNKAQAEERTRRFGEELLRLQQQAAQAAAESKTANTKAGDGGALTRAARPRVFIQFAGDLNRVAQIEPLRAALDSAGFDAPPAERIDRGQSNEVRVFVDSAEEKQLAKQVAEVVLAHFAKAGCPLSAVPVRLIALPGGRASPLEVWLKHNCRG